MHLQTHKNKPVKNFGSFDSFKFDFDDRERKNNAVNHQKTAYGKGFGVPEVIRTPDLSLRSMACCFVRFSSNNFLSHEIRACVMMYMTKMTQNTQNTALLWVFRGVQLANS